MMSGKMVRMSRISIMLVVAIISLIAVKHNSGIVLRADAAASAVCLSTGGLEGIPCELNVYIGTTVTVACATGNTFLPGASQYCPTKDVANCADAKQAFTTLKSKATIADASGTYTITAATTRDDAFVEPETAFIGCNVSGTANLYKLVFQPFTEPRITTESCEEGAAAKTCEIDMYLGDTVKIQCATGATFVPPAATVAAPGQACIELNADGSCKTKKDFQALHLAIYGYGVTGDGYVIQANTEKQTGQAAKLYGDCTNKTTSVKTNWVITWHQMTRQEASVPRVFVCNPGDGQTAANPCRHEMGANDRALINCNKLPTYNPDFMSGGVYCPKEITDIATMCTPTEKFSDHEIVSSAYATNVRQLKWAPKDATTVVSFTVNGACGPASSAGGAKSLFFSLALGTTTTTTTTPDSAESFLRSSLIVFLAIIFTSFISP